MNELYGKGKLEGIRSAHLKKAEDEQERSDKLYTAAGEKGRSLISSFRSSGHAFDRAAKAQAHRSAANRASALLHRRDGKLGEDNASMDNLKESLPVALGEAVFLGFFEGNYTYGIQNMEGRGMVVEGANGFETALYAIQEAKQSGEYALKTGYDVEPGKFKGMGQQGHHHWFAARTPGGALVYTRNVSRGKAAQAAKREAEHHVMEGVKPKAPKKVASYNNSWRRHTGRDLYSHDVGVWDHGDPTYYEVTHDRFIPKQHFADTTPHDAGHTETGVEKINKSALKDFHKFMKKEKYTGGLHEDVVQETLPSDAKAGDYIDDFVHSDNSKFDGKSKKERIKMALGAYYGHHKEGAFDKAEDDPAGPKSLTASGGGMAIGEEGENGEWTDAARKDVEHTAELFRKAGNKKDVHAKTLRNFRRRSVAWNKKNPSPNQNPTAPKDAYPELRNPEYRKKAFSDFGKAIRKEEVVEEGAFGPTRMQLQHTLDQHPGSTQRAKINYVEKAHNVRNVRLNSKGDIIHFELNEGWHEGPTDAELHAIEKEQSRPKHHVKACSYCGGTGKVHAQSHNPHGPIETACSHCGGKGRLNEALSDKEIESLRVHGHPGGKEAADKHFGSLRGPRGISIHSKEFKSQVGKGDSKEVECPSCHGKGCSRCDDQGHLHEAFGDQKKVPVYHKDRKTLIGHVSKSATSIGAAKLAGVKSCEKARIRDGKSEWGHEAWVVKEEFTLEEASDKKKVESGKKDEKPTPRPKPFGKFKKDNAAAASDKKFEKGDKKDKEAAGNDDPRQGDEDDDAELKYNHGQEGLDSPGEHKSSGPGQDGEKPDFGGAEKDEKEGKFGKKGSDKDNENGDEEGNPNNTFGQKDDDDAAEGPEGADSEDGEEPPIKLSGKQDKVVLNPVQVVRDMTASTISPPQSSGS